VTTRKRSLGVAEARFGLGLVILMLLVLGYVALQRLGGTGDTPPEIWMSAAPPSIKPPARVEEEADQKLQILPAQADDPTDKLHMSQRPAWAAPPVQEGNASFDLNESDSLWRSPAAANIQYGPPSESRR
jgi:hypothetical protein